MRVRRREVLAALFLLVAAQALFLLFASTHGPSTNTGHSAEMLASHLLDSGFGGEVNDPASAGDAVGEDDPFGTPAPPKSAPFWVLGRDTAKEDPVEDVTPRGAVLFPRRYADTDAALSVEFQGETANDASREGDKRYTRAREEFIRSRRQSVAVRATKYAIVTHISDVAGVDAAVALGHSIRVHMSCLTAEGGNTNRCTTVLLYGGSTNELIVRSKPSAANTNGTVLVDLRDKLRQAGWAIVREAPGASSGSRSLSPLALFGFRKFERVLHVDPHQVLLLDWSHLLTSNTPIPEFSPGRIGEDGEEISKSQVTVHCLVDKTISTADPRAVPVERRTRIGRTGDFNVGTAPGVAVLPLAFVATRMPDVLTKAPTFACDIGSRSFFNQHNNDLHTTLTTKRKLHAKGDESGKYQLRDHDWAMKGGAFGLPTLPYTPQELELWLQGLKAGVPPPPGLRAQDVKRRFRSGPDVLVDSDDLVERVWLYHYERVALRVARRFLAFAQKGGDQSVLFGRGFWPWPNGPQAGVTAEEQGRALLSYFAASGGDRTSTPKLALGIKTAFVARNVSTYSQLAEERNTTVKGLTLVASSPGESCLAACQRQSIATACAPSALQWLELNTCDVLRKAFDPSKGGCHECSDSLNSLGVAPAYRQDDGLCLLHHYRSTTVPTCAASAPNVARLCSCIDPEVAAQAPVQKRDHSGTPPPVVPNPQEVAHEQREAEDQNGINEKKEQGKADSGGPEAVGAGGAYDVKAEAEKAASDDDCPCPVGVIAPKGEAEDSCLEYLSNFSNVVSINALLSTLKYGRTVKFQLQYKRSCVKAVAKVPQSLFPLEPYAEYTAFELDRELKMNYVPPTTWIFIPITDIENAAVHSLNVAEQGGSGIAKDVGAGGSAEAATDFGKWVNAEVLKYALAKKLVAMDPVRARMTLGCSVQLWMKGASPLHRTPLRYDEQYTEMMTAPIASLIARGGNIEAAIPQSKVLQKVLRRSEQKKYAMDVLRYLSDSIVFDSILSNDDRGPIKNSNAIKLNAHQLMAIDSTNRPQADRAGAKSGWIPLHLDQGKSFYSEQIPKEMPISDLGPPRIEPHKQAQPPPGICMFANRTYTILKYRLGNSRLTSAFKDILPQEIFEYMGAHRFHAAQARVAKLINHIDRCIASLGAETVLAWQ